MRKRRGVYYTPVPVVSYMVRSVDILLKEKFDKPLGLADPEVMILDPACGTGTFLLKIFQEILKKFENNREALTAGLADKSWSGYVKERLLPRVFGFELLMAPYAIAHLKLGLFLEETGYQFDNGKRLGVYLTNTLDNAIKKTETLLEEYIAEESNQAADIKRNKPLMIIIGNPPYSQSIFEGDWIMDLVEDYKKNLKEKKSDLNREEWKFLRFAQHKIDNVGKGIVTFIINNTFADAVTHRQLRHSLKSSFNSIDFFDLHGSVKGKTGEISKEKDDNVFDITQGVGVFFGIRTDEEQSLRHQEIFGSQESKYTMLENSDIRSVRWQELPRIDSEFHFFCPKESVNSNEYRSHIKITDAFTIYNSGVKTDRDSLFIDFDSESLLERIDYFYSGHCLADKLFIENFNVKNSSSYNLLKCRQNTSFDPKNIRKILYKPFDFRFIYYSPGLTSRPAWKAMQHLIDQENLALITMRQVVNQSYDHFGISDSLTSHGTFYLGNKGQDYIFPLYLYPDSGLPRELQQEKRSNLSKIFLEQIEIKLGFLPNSEEIFHYIYSIFHSSTYRIRFLSDLKIDFPRIPLTKDSDLFFQLSEYGSWLIDLHLMRSEKLDQFITQYQGVKQPMVEIPGAQKAYSEGKVSVNKQGDGFTGVPEEVWNFHVGGYQVCHKWLKDRKDRTLSDDDILHYQRIVVALKETITLMQKIDEAIPSWPIE